MRCGDDIALPWPEGLRARMTAELLHLLNVLGSLLLPRLIAGWIVARPAPERRRRARGGDRDAGHGGTL